MIGSPIERFFDKVDIDDTGCWMWVGAITSTGYGSFYVSRDEWVSTHRFIYQLMVGPIPAQLDLDHLCRVRACCNPDHLEPVTRRENVTRAKAAITHCPAGHPYDQANTYVYTHPHGATQRFCRECSRNRKRAA